MSKKMIFINKLFLKLKLVLLCALASSTVMAATTINLSPTPLYATRQAHPNLVVSLSVEFPTVSRAYSKDQSNNYIPYVASNTYLGYFNENWCYQYSVTPALAAASALRTPAVVNASNEYFAPVSLAAANHSCPSATLFSGNFMNWATMSAVDELRFALTGGNRVIDSNGTDPRTAPSSSASPKTVLLRAFLPDGAIAGVNNFWNTSSTNINWPYSQISTSASSGSYAAVAPSTVTPFSDTTLYTTGCRNLIFFNTNLSGSSCDTPYSSTSVNRGIYRVAVQVCDTVEGPARPSLCKQYTPASGPSIYKPVGQVQKYADQMRYAVFGYLMDQSPPTSGCADGTWNECRYGGVLRNKMKYVGTNKYDAALNATTNAYKEINDDGTFIANPDGSDPDVSPQGLSNSGFINYINKFGQSGLYKRRDPAGEMYYEALRYLAHQSETPEAIVNMNTAMKDGFPVMTGTGWTTDPILSSCQKNYIINVADANTNDDWYLPGFSGGKTYRPNSRPADSYFTPSFNAVNQTNLLGNLAGAPINGIPGNNALNTVAPNFENRSGLGAAGISNGSYLLAGAAYWANTNDIRPDLPGQQTVKTISFDVAEAAGTVNQRQLYLAGKYGGFTDSNNDGNPFVASQTVGGITTNVSNNSEWESSPGSAYPTNYVLASSPSALINGLAAAFATAAAPSNTASGISLTSANILYNNSSAFSATFDPTRWSGSVKNQALSYNNVTGTITTVTPAIWDAATQLDTFLGSIPLPNTTLNPAIPANAALRKVFTMLKVGVGATSTPSAFNWASISTDISYSTYLNTNPQTSLVDALGQNRVNYLRGDRLTDEASASGNHFRLRDSAFGDVINSAPVYVGSPSTSITDNGYSTFYTTYINRTPAVYVGANDGMLHAINATNGNELFAYVPRILAPKLNQLTNPAYTHIPFVDAVPAVREVNLGTTSTPNWKTVLVSGLGAGFQGVFALDVTNPSGFGTSNVLWEFSDADDPDFVNVVGSPTIVKINTAAANGTPVYKWFAIVTGYNNLQPDGASTTATDQSGMVFILALNKATSSPWVLGSNYYKIKTPYAAPYFNTANPNGLSPVAALANPKGTIDAVALYTGDLQGNLWKIDLTGGSSTWSGNTPVMFGQTPLFSARDGSGNPQPITERPVLTSAPNGGVLVLFGTGKYLEQTDVSSTAQQSFYAIYDNRGTTAATAINLITGRSALASRTVSPAVTPNTFSITGAAVTYSGASAQKGWYFDFPSTASGERSISTPALDSGLAFFSTITMASSACGAGGGYIYNVNVVTGIGSSSISNVGIPGPVQIVNTSFSDGAKHASGETVTKATKTALTPGSGGLSLSNPTTIKLPKGRIAWRQLTTN